MIKYDQLNKYQNSMINTNIKIEMQNSLNDPSKIDSLNCARIQHSSLFSSQFSTPTRSELSRTKTIIFDDTLSFNFRDCSPPKLPKSPNNLSIFTPQKSNYSLMEFDKTKTVNIKGRKGKLYEELCPICLQCYQDPRGVLQCSHEFCFQCLNQWAKSSTGCPCCRAPFKAIKKYSQKEVELIEVEEKVFEFKYEDYFICYNCGLGDNQHVLLVCDGCDFYCCHIYCDSNLSDNVPEGDWFCKYCEERLKNQQENIEMNLSMSTVSMNSEGESSEKSLPIANRTRAQRGRENRVRFFQRRRRR